MGNEFHTETKGDTVPYIERSFPRNLATSAKREVPRATCNERVSAKFPAQETMFPFIFIKNRVIYHFVNDI